MEQATGIEPALQAWEACALPLSYACRGAPVGALVVGGAGGVTRTPDLLITNQLLYRLSYTSANMCIIPTLISFVKQFVAHNQKKIKFWDFALDNRGVLCYNNFCLLRAICEHAGIGRQARLRGVCFTTCGFKSHCSHH